MYKAFLDTLKQAGITLPSWIFVIILVLLACGIVSVLFKNYAIPFFVKIIKIYKDVCSIDNIKNLQMKSIEKSMEKDNELEGKICALDTKLDNVVEILNDMQKKSNETEMLKTQDRLVQMYRYYTAPEHNGQWNEIEKDTFWKLFRDYENRGGDGYMHEIVEPAMRKLEVVKIIKD